MIKNRISKIILISVLLASLLCLSSCTGKEESSKASSAVSSEVSVTASYEQNESTRPVSEEEKSLPVVSEDEESSGYTAYGTKTVPAEWQDSGIFSAYYQRAYDIVQNMTLEEKVGQILLVRCPAIDGSAQAKEFHLGGYILFGRDFDDYTRNEITANTRSYLDSQTIPMIIAVDEEGGTVSRLSYNPELTDHKFKSPRELFDIGGIDAVIEEAETKNKLMKSLNINTNLAPVCDISKSEENFMYDRSLGQDPDITSDFVRRFTKVSQDEGISVTLKHFPGYGNNVDTHTGIAIDERTYETFVQNDFKPFKAGIDEGAHMVLVSHNIVNCMDDEHPASLSSKVHEILRNELGFTGIIVTDDLEMDAIKQYFTEYSPNVAAVLAGNDMLCVSDYEQAFKDITEAVQNGRIDTDILDHAAVRVIAWKYVKGLITE